MWSNFGVQTALSGFKAVGSFITAAAEAKSARKWQAYNNAMTRLQNAQNQNNLTANEGMLIERTTREAYNIRVSEYKTKSSAIVAAAAVGTEGNSVDAVLTDIGRNAAKATSALITDTNYQVQGIRDQQRSSNLQMEMQLDQRSIPSPSIASSLLSFGAEVGTKWYEDKLELNKYKRGV